MFIVSQNQEQKRKELGDTSHKHVKKYTTQQINEQS